MGKHRENFQLRFRRGSYSAGLTAAVVAGIILLNLIFRSLPAGLIHYDLSMAGLYNLTDETVEMLRGLEDDITIAVIYENATADSRIQVIAKEYEKYSDHITTELVNLTEDPAAADFWGATNQNVVVKDAQTGRQKIIPFADIVVLDDWAYYKSGVRTETSFDGEGQLTSAIAYVTGSADYTIYVTEGHQESELSNTVTASLGKSNYTIKSVNLMQAGLPGDCNLLIINDPKTDFAENELELVRGKLADGGGVMLLSENLHEQPRLKSLLESMGITVTDGYVAELERYYQQSYYEFFPVLSTESTITAGIDSNSLALVTEALGMRLSAAEGVTLTSFMDTSAYAAGVIAGQRVNGVFSIGASAALVDGGALTVITAPTLIYPEITDAFSNAANFDIFVNAAAELIGSDDTTVIPAHSLQPVYNSVANPGAWSIPCVLLAPALFLAGGFIYWRRRQRA